MIYSWRSRRAAVSSASRPANREVTTEDAPEAPKGWGEAEAAGAPVDGDGVPDGISGMPAMYTYGREHAAIAVMLL